MFGRLKSALVRSFIGAITIGWMLAESVVHLASAISVPVTVLLQERMRQEQMVSALAGSGTASVRLTAQNLHFPLEMAIPQLMTALVLLAVALLLLWWLYFPAREETVASSTE